MPNVSYNGNVYVCAVAIKGVDFIKLLDENDCPVATFEGISDFSHYAISDGEWSAPEDVGDCYIAVMRRDGSIERGPHKCHDIAAVAAYSCVLPASFLDGWFTHPSGFFMGIAVPDLSKDDLVLILSTTDDAWAQSSLNITTADGQLSIVATSLPSADVTMRFSVTKLKGTVVLN